MRLGSDDIEELKFEAWASEIILGAALVRNFELKFEKSAQLFVSIVFTGCDVFTTPLSSLSPPMRYP